MKLLNFKGGTKMEKLKQLLIPILALSIFLVPFSNLASASDGSSFRATPISEDENLLKEILEQDGVTDEELEKYSKQAKEHVYAKDGVEINWKLSAVKKAVKFVVDHHELIPSKTIRDYVKKYGNKMIKAMDKLESGTKSGLTKAFKKAGIPDKVAKALADFIVTFIL